MRFGAGATRSVRKSVPPPTKAPWPPPSSPRWTTPPKQMPAIQVGQKARPAGLPPACSVQHKITTAGQRPPPAAPSFPRIGTNVPVVKSTYTPVEEQAFILLSGGGQRRWENYMNIPKHLAPIKGEPLLVRTCRQIKERIGIHPLVLAHDPRIIEAIGAEHCFQEHDQGVITAGALSSRPFWKRRTWLIDGDAYWCSAAMNQLCSLTGMRAVWSLTQFFGFHFDTEEDTQRVENALTRTVELSKTARGSMSSRGLGYMLYAFHLMQGLPVCEEPHSLNGGHHRKDSKWVEEVKGLARDFDFPYDYNNFLRAHPINDLP